MKTESPSPKCNLVVIRSSDIERAASLYEAMGMSFTRHAHGSGPEHYASENDGFTFEIYPLREGGTPTTAVRIGFAVGDVDAVFQQLAQIGAIIVSSPCETEWGRRAVLRDFDGHTIELTS